MDADRQQRWWRVRAGGGSGGNLGVFAVALFSVALVETAEHVRSARLRVVVVAVVVGFPVAAVVAYVAPTRLVQAAI